MEATADGGKRIIAENKKELIKSIRNASLDEISVITLKGSDFVVTLDPITARRDHENAFNGVYRGELEKIANKLNRLPKTAF